MSKDFFQFKQFGVYHGIDTLKVCTESCILGATAHIENPKNILDIGTGSGLIALMIAQRLPGMIEGIEIMEASYRQAKANFEASPWKDRLTVHHRSLNDRLKDNPPKYDLIVSNPPFYANHEISNKNIDQVTKHEVLLDQASLAQAIASLISNNGKSFVLYPTFEMKRFQEHMKTHLLFPSHSLLIKNFAHKVPFRVITCFEKRVSEHIHEELIIYDAPQVYTSQFEQLMKGYYLIF